VIEFYNISEYFWTVVVRQICNLYMRRVFFNVSRKSGNDLKLLFDYRELSVWDSKSTTIWLLKECSHDTVLVEPQRKFKLSWDFISLVVACKNKLCFDAPCSVIYKYWSWVERVVKIRSGVCIIVIFEELLELKISGAKWCFRTVKQSWRGKCLRFYIPRLEWMKGFIDNSDYSNCAP
jgi:hypothetical protein